LASRCASSNARIVSGTTAMGDQHLAPLRQLAKNRACVLAPNFSVGVNLLFKLSAMAAKVLGDEFDAEIIEAHHRQKADAPSGTALRIGESIAEGRGVDFDEVALLSREGMIGARPTGQIGFATVRGGQIVGDHTALFAGPAENFTLGHQALSRDTLAGGALRAVRWVMDDQQPGLYDMQDVLELRS
jgi:4-hydroxy-tetrahydrodipicolinate reductase